MFTCLLFVLFYFVFYCYSWHTEDSFSCTNKRKTASHVQTNGRQLLMYKQTEDSFSCTNKRKTASHVHTNGRQLLMYKQVKSVNPFAFFLFVFGSFLIHRILIYYDACSASNTPIRLQFDFISFNISMLWDYKLSKINCCFLIIET